MNLAPAASLSERLPKYQLHTRVTSFVTLKVNNTSQRLRVYVKMLFRKELASANDFRHKERVPGFTTRCIPS